MATTSGVECTIALHDARDEDGARIGRKAAALAELAAAGLTVPEGIVLTTAAFEAVRTHAGLPADVTPEAVLAAPLPGPVVAALESVIAHFGDAVLAVRSSGVAEDGADASFAGQYDTVLGVQGLAALRSAVRRCWASAFGERVRGYQDGRAAGAGIAVLVQRQVDADVAGVAFTADPVTGERGAVLVSAVPGSGDTLVSGAIDADEWRYRDGVATPVRIRHRALTEAQAGTVADLALRIELLRGGPQDVEWAMAGGKLYVLQARPVTALPQSPVIDLPAGTTWVKEAERHPEPISALGASVIGDLVARGLTTMSRESGGLVDHFEVRAIGGEPYVRVVPIGGHDGPPPPWWLLAVIARLAPPMRRQMRRAEQALAPGALEAVLRRWEHEWRPQLQSGIQRLQEIELAALDDAALRAHLDDTVAFLDHGLEIHFRLTLPYVLAVHDLLVACRRLGWPDERSLELLAGTSHATSAPAAALAEVAAAIAAGSDAETALRDWGDRYGRCCVNDDPGSPTLVELPEALSALVRDAVAAAHDGRAERLAATRAERAAEAHAALKDRSAQRAEFDRALAAALRAYPVREDSAFWTASMPAGLVRTAAVEAGRRLVRHGVLARPQDAAHLDLATLRATLTDPASHAEAARAVVARSRAERAYVRVHPGPPFLGPPPPRLPDVRGLPAAGRRINTAMLDMQRPPVPAASPASDVLLRGVPGSGGRCTGPVRIVRGAADFRRLRAGEILVCPTTDPAWSVLFALAGGLVTDGGNVLSHAAIVAREHGIPAVVGAGAATSTLRDGQVVTVDGTAGAVLDAR